MTLLELSNRVRQEFDKRNLKSRTRYYALNNVIGYIQECHGGNLSVLKMNKFDFKDLYKEFKSSIGKAYSGAEDGAINEIYNQFAKLSEPECIAPIKTEKVTERSSTSIEKLMNKQLFRRVGDLCESMVPVSPGLYAIRINDVHELPSPFCEELINRQHDLLYIGIASKSLRERLWKEELNHTSPATFFRSIGAILGFRPEKGSLYGKKTRNYKFSEEDTETIIAWIKEHILVNFIIINSNLKEIETRFIKENKPIVNIDKNPYKMKALRDLRDECLKIASEK